MDAKRCPEDPKGHKDLMDAKRCPEDPKDPKDLMDALILRLLPKVRHVAYREPGIVQ